MRKYFGICLVSLVAVGIMGLLTACSGDAEANPTRWNVSKVMIPSEVAAKVAESSDCSATLEFCDQDSGDVEFTRNYELSAGQTEIVVGEVPADQKYTVRLRITADGNDEAVAECVADCEPM